MCFRSKEKATALGLSIGELPQWRDVDTIEDLTMLIEASQLDAGNKNRNNPSPQERQEPCSFLPNDSARP